MKFKIGDRVWLHKRSRLRMEYGVGTVIYVGKKQSVINFDLAYSSISDFTIPIGNNALRLYNGEIECKRDFRDFRDKTRDRSS